MTDCKIVTLPIFLLDADSQNQAGQYDLVTVKNGDPGTVMSTMDSVLSLDGGTWPRLQDESCTPVVNKSWETSYQLLNIKQPSPPPVLAQVHPEYAPIPPSKVSDPRPGPPKCPQDSALGTASYQHLHIVR